MIMIMIISIKASSWVSSHHVTERWDGRVIITEYKINFINLYVSVTQRESYYTQMCKQVFQFYSLDGWRLTTTLGKSQSC